MYSCTTTDSYKVTGIYSATRRKSSNQVVVDWGDGSKSSVNGNISQLTHTYSSVGKFYVTVSNISAIALGYNSNTWYQTTTKNRYIVDGAEVLTPNITELSNYCLYYCGGLTSFTIPSSVTTLGNGVFGYTGLTQGVIPSTVTTMGTTTFTGCKSLLSARIEASLTTLPATTFSNCTALSSVSLPNSITILNMRVFMNCSSLTEFTLGPNVTSIGNLAFQGCSNVATLRSYAMTAPTVTATSFGNMNTATTIIGYNGKSSGNNKLIVPIGATGYDDASTSWATVLCNSSYGGFTLQYGE